MNQIKLFTNHKKMKITKTWTLDDGKIYNIEQLEDMTGVDRKKLWYRLAKGMNNLEDLSIPAYCKKRGNKLSAFEETYKNLSPKLRKLLFGKW